MAEYVPPLVTISDAIKVEPGDRLLIAFNRSFDQQTADEVNAQLRERFPDVEFTVVSNVASVAVQRASSGSNNLSGSPEGTSW